MSQIGFLKKYLGLFDEQSEPWKGPHQAVMEAYRKADGLSETVAHGLFILDRIAKCSSRTEDSEVTISQAEELCKAYQGWYTTASTILTGIENSEREGFPVEGADQLRESHQQLGSKMQGICLLRQSIDDYKNGRAKPLEKVFDELRSFHQPHGDREA